MASQTTSNIIIPLRTLYFANTSTALSTFLLANNLYALANPTAALQMLGFPVQKPTEDGKLITGLTRMFATTRLTLALSGLAMWWYGATRPLGWANLAGVGMAIVDGFVSRDVIGKGEWNHWGAAPVGTIVGLGLLLGVE